MKTKTYTITDKSGVNLRELPSRKLIKVCCSL